VPQDRQAVGAVDRDRLDRVVAVTTVARSFSSPLTRSATTERSGKGEAVGGKVTSAAGETSVKEGLQKMDRMGCSASGAAPCPLRRERSRAGREGDDPALFHVQSIAARDAR
jgi:hypothetical protein